MASVPPSGEKCNERIEDIFAGRTQNASDIFLVSYKLNLMSSFRTSVATVSSGLDFLLQLLSHRDSTNTQRNSQYDRQENAILCKLNGYRNENLPSPRSASS